MRLTGPRGFPRAASRATVAACRHNPPSVRPEFSRETRLTAVIVASALFMQNLDSTIIATALPTMARSFGYDPVRMNVALTSYLLSLTVFIPASGWVADRYGTRNVFRGAIVVFTVGSILCGLSNGLRELVAARVLQGIGGAMMVPVGRLLLLRTAAKSELVAAMAWLTVPALLGPVVGPPLGGFIVTYFNWRWTFFINIPVGLIGILAVTLFIQDFREPPKGAFDLRGLVLTGAALVCVMFGLETIGRGLVSPELTEVDDRRRPGVRVPVLPACEADRRAAAGFHPDAAALLRAVVHRHDAVPHRHRGDPVPAADDVAGRLRRRGGGERADHLRQFRRARW